jgi:protein-L-isoaspartate(D-aspartate) O-methyltransferase
MKLLILGFKITDKMIDTPLHQGLRNRLVQELHNKGIKDKKVLQAIAKIPRHLLLESAFEPHAYQDKAFPIAAEQTISQPYTVAFQTELLKIQTGDKVLEIGTGSGYQAAILYTLGAQVYTIERIKELYLNAKTNLNKIGIKLKYMSYGDGYKGLALYAPYDKIIVTAAAPHIPEALTNQLKPGGRMVIPVGKETQIMTLIEKDQDGQLHETKFGEFRFVPMLKDKI